MVGKISLLLTRIHFSNTGVYGLYYNSIPLQIGKESTRQIGFQIIILSAFMDRANWPVSNHK
jgi:hypothetical protein